MKEVALLVLALLPSSSLQLPPASVRLKEYQVCVEQASAEAERTLKHTIDFNLKQSREPLPKGELARVRERIANAKKKLKALPKAELTAGLPTTLAVGDIGTIAEMCPKPTRIVDEREAVAMLRVFFEKLGAGGLYAAAQNDEVLTPVLIKGVSTEGWATDRYRSVPGLFRVTGTQQVSTIAGAKTIFVIEPYELPKKPQGELRLSECGRAQ